MLDMGFQDTIDIIIEQVPKARQTLLFSATYPDEIQSIAERVMLKPVMARVERTSVFFMEDTSVFGSN